MEWTNGLWAFNGESKKRIGHPAPFPIELPRRCIKLFSYVDDVVLDPFSGSGTTLIAAMANKRRGIGIDVDRKYCKLAHTRILESLTPAQVDLPKEKSKTTKGKTGKR
jgi:site-specific DNA-methyltransferase (adenine-specific)